MDKLETRSVRDSGILRRGLRKMTGCGISTGGCMSPRRKHTELDPPYRDPVFMDSLPARPVRIITEYIDPLERLRREKVGDTIVMFGSARIHSREHALDQLSRLRKRKASASTPEHRAALSDAKAALEMSRYYEEARELSRKITTWAMTLGDRPRRFVICSGGGPGIMEAANRGAADAGGKSIGLSIELPHEQRPNDYISPELSLMFHYFFMRKLWFAQLAKALIVFPGGFGTMDELWEMLTLMQTGKLQRRNLILIYGRKYWDRVLDWKYMQRCGTISRRDYSLLQFADTVDEAFQRVRHGVDKYHLEPDTLLKSASEQIDRKQK
jgi:uncharacterized protein (TIGR00730 family)